MDYNQLLKKYKKKKIISETEIPYPLNYNIQDIEKIIPHREPFLLIDRLTGLDIKEETIIGEKFISNTDPILKGHFPDYPVYPGSLQLEMTGQLGLCLSYFIFNNTSTIQENIKPLNIRATKIIGAIFLEPLLPDNKAVIIAKKLEYDSFFGTIIGQVISNNKICSVSISEVCFLD